MHFYRDGAFRSLMLPGGILLAGAVVFVQSGLLRNFSATLNFFYYTAFAAGFLLAWRFHSSRVFSALLLMLLAQRAIEFFSQGHAPHLGPSLAAFEAIAFLVPLDLVLLAASAERGLSLSTTAPRFLVLLVESVFVAIICRPAPSAGANLFHGALVNRTWSSWTPVPQISLLVFLAALIFLCIRAFSRPKPVASGFVWVLLAFFLSLNAGGVSLDARAYVASAAMILVVSVVETSYAMAYHDELTGLPSRRAFNEATFRLEVPYTVAAVDIDHFKSVNDTYGHETGDEVLCMVGARLARVTAGGQPFRVGGEEFTILFPGKTAHEVMDDLEMLRALIEQTPFRLRGRSERRSIPRGPDRRTAAKKKSPKSKSLSNCSADLTVTVSIGVAEPTASVNNFEAVLKFADEALYRAKRAGRNRVEVADRQRKRSRKKTGENIA